MVRNSPWAFSRGAVQACFSASLQGGWSACPGLSELGAAGVLTASIRLLEDLLPNCETCTMPVTPCKLQVPDPNAQAFLELALVAGPLFR